MTPKMTSASRSGDHYFALFLICAPLPSFACNACRCSSIMLVADPTMGQTFFQHFRCRTLSEDLWVMDADYSIECSPEDKTSEWWILAAVSALGLIFVIGFPIGASHYNFSMVPSLLHVLLHRAQAYGSG